LEKNRLVEFVAKIMEESGFKVYKNFKTSRHLIDIYGVLSTVLGDVGVVVACKNYDERWNVGLDVLKEMEMVAKTLKASKVVIVTTSGFTDKAINYASRRNMKLIDRDGLMSLAKKFSKKDYEIDETEEMMDETYTPKSGSKSDITYHFTGGKRSLRKRDRILGSWAPNVVNILKSTPGLILIVLILSWTITYIIGSMATTTPAVLRILLILFSALLSYGLVLMIDRDFAVTLIKGSTIFFVSLLVYIILIIF